MSISRSEYQRVVEENKRLLQDIRILVQDGFMTEEKIQCRVKWAKKFQREEEFNKHLKEALQAFVKDNIGGISVSVKEEV